MSFNDQNNLYSFENMWSIRVSSFSLEKFANDGIRTRRNNRELEIGGKQICGWRYLYAKKWKYETEAIKFWFCNILGEEIIFAYLLFILLTF